MTTILSVTVLVTLLSLSAFQAVKNKRNPAYADVKSVMMPRLLASLAVMASCNMACSGYDLAHILSDSVISVMSASLMVISVRPPGRLPFHVGPLPVLVPVLSLYYILCAIGILKTPGTSFFVILSVFAALSSAGMFLWMIWRRIRDVKSVMKSGNVWSFLTLCTDFIYIIVPLMLLSVLGVVSSLFPRAFTFSVICCIFLMCLEVVAIAFKVACDSAFVILHDHERVIVESMKIAHMDAPLSSGSKEDEMYKELYERIVLYFEMSKPYLDGNLTISDVVKVVYSNKVYISKAIFHYTGRNFRQFVNFYRIMYSMDLFRENLEMKVSELSEKSGFNTMVSYTMAFRLFMNETPSEWCRKERSKILKQKK